MLPDVEPATVVCAELIAIELAARKEPLVVLVPGHWMTSAVVPSIIWLDAVLVADAPSAVDDEYVAFDAPDPIHVELFPTAFEAFADVPIVITSEAAPNAPAEL